MLNGSKDLQIICQNIRDLSERKNVISEQSKLFCDLLASSITDNSDTIPENLLRYASQLDDCSNGGDDSNIIDLFYSVAEKIGFSPTLLFNSTSSFQVFSRTASAKIVYVKNNFSDAAFVCFSTLFEKPKVSYKTSFEDVCEDVYNAVGDYCILPIENANGGKLFSFYSLIDKYDLKIFAVCDLYEGNSEHRTRYALLSRKNLVHLEKAARAYIEFSIIAEDGYAMRDILSAAERYGLRLYRIDTVSVPYDDSAFRFYYVFESTGNGAIPFLIYLNFRYPQHEPIGYYISL